MIRPATPIAVIALATFAIVASCDGGGGMISVPVPVATTVERIEGNAQAGTAGTVLAVDPTIEVRDQDGAVMPGVRVRFAATGGGATTDTTVETGADGRARVSWLLRPGAIDQDTLGVTVGSLMTEFRATAATPVPGQTYLGRNGYIEYIAGDIPLIISAPHGGTELPSELPDRTGTGITTVRDGNTSELARAIGDAFMTRTGRRPHLIITRLRRTKIDTNREIAEAAQGHSLTERAWIEYHTFIETAKRAAIARHGTGLYVDLHGHGHAVQRLELGYLLTRTHLALSDGELNQATHENRSSIRTLSQASPAGFSELLRGPQSLGGLFEAQAIPAVPSPASPDPGAEAYFDGGYNTARHGSRDGGPISGVQIECNFTGVRDTPANRTRFGNAFVAVWEEFVASNALVSDALESNALASNTLASNALVGDALGSNALVNNTPAGGALAYAPSVRRGSASRAAARLPQRAESHEAALLRIP